RREAARGRGRGGRRGEGQRGHGRREGVRDGRERVLERERDGRGRRGRGRRGGGRGRRERSGRRREADVGLRHRLALGGRGAHERIVLRRDHLGERGELAHPLFHLLELRFEVGAVALVAFDARRKAGDLL